MIDVENLIDEIEIVQGRVNDMMKEIKEREEEIALCRKKIDDWKEYKIYLHMRLRINASTWGGMYITETKEPQR